MTTRECFEPSQNSGQSLRILPCLFYAAKFCCNGQAPFFTSSESQPAIRKGSSELEEQACVTENAACYASHS